MPSVNCSAIKPPPACGSVPRDECITSCAGWDSANRLCIDNTPGNDCERMSRCFGDESGQARCREACDHLQSCLLEACPPQIIPPDYSDDCTAGCLYQPPAQRLVDEYTNTACRQVREQIYQENQGLRPVCGDGGQDFRPTAAECTDVCESSSMRVVTAVKVSVLVYAEPSPVKNTHVPSKMEQPVPLSTRAYNKAKNSKSRARQQLDGSQTVIAWCSKNCSP